MEECVRSTTIEIVSNCLKRLHSCTSVITGGIDFDRPTCFTVAVQATINKYALEYEPVVLDGQLFKVSVEDLGVDCYRVTFTMEEKTVTNAGPVLVSISILHSVNIFFNGSSKTLFVINNTVGHGDMMKLLLI